MTHFRFQIFLLSVVVGFAVRASLNAAEHRNLAPHGTFEGPNDGFNGWIPLGVIAESDTHGIRVVEGVAHSGQKALRITPGPSGLVEGVVYFADYNGGEGKRQATREGGIRGARTFAMRLDSCMTAIEASAWMKEPSNGKYSLTAVWTTRRARRPVIEIRRDTVNASSRNEAGWEQFELRAERPDGAQQMQLWIETEDDAPLFVDDVQLRFTYKPQLKILVDQLGYSPDSMTKMAVLQATMPLDEVPTAQIIDQQTGEVVRKTNWVAHGFLYDQWDRDENGLADILDEAIWGNRFVQKMLDPDRLELLEAVSSGYRYWGPPEKETDNRPNTGDERPVRPGRGDPSYCVPGFALLGHALKKCPRPETAEYGQQLVDLAVRFHKKIGGGTERLIPLYVATDKPRYRQLARERAQSLLASQSPDAVSGFRELAHFAIAFPNDELVPKIRQLGKRRAVELAAICDGRFGVALRREGADSLVYFRRYNHVNDWYVGETSYRLDAAIDGQLASRLGSESGRMIAEDQIHWLLGRNPYGLSYMEGVGTKHLPLYHHRYNAIPGNPRGAVPGALIN